MVRKSPFKPLVHQDGYISPMKERIEIHGQNMDHRDKEALIFPSKIKDRTVKWGIQSL
jgi:hypothetical protein